MDMSDAATPPPTAPVGQEIGKRRHDFLRSYSCGVQLVYGPPGAPYPDEGRPRYPPLLVKTGALGGKELALLEKMGRKVQMVGWLISLLAAYASLFA